MKTLLPRAEDIKRKWHLIDAKNVVLGRLASEVANILRGKTKPIFTPFLDTGDYVVIINAKEVLLTGKKDEQKVYRRHSGYVGGLKATDIKTMRKEKPEEIIRQAIKGMMPKNKLSRAVINKLKIYADDKHPHEGQNPVLLKI